jgi:hypothetical protein
MYCIGIGIGICICIVDVSLPYNSIVITTLSFTRLVAGAWTSRWAGDSSYEPLQRGWA